MYVDISMIYVCRHIHDICSTLVYTMDMSTDISMDMSTDTSTHVYAYGVCAADIFFLVVFGDIMCVEKCMVMLP